MTDWVEELQAARTAITAARQQVGEAGKQYRMVVLRCIVESGNVTQASRVLGLSRQALYRAIRKSATTSGC